MLKLMGVVIFSILFAFVNCNKVEKPTQTVDNQYVVLATIPDSLHKNCWFNIVNIINGKEKCVFAVKEIEGTYYLPILSRYPSFNDKIVNGNFVKDSVIGMTSADTLFEVTAILRDTIGNFPH